SFGPLVWLSCVLPCSALWCWPWTCPEKMYLCFLLIRINPLESAVSLSYARSNCAYFSTSFLSPNRGNCTVILALSPSPSRRYTTPSPYLGCRTRCPGRSAGRLAFSCAGWAAVLVKGNFFPREAKNSAMLSIELYLGPA